jgi:hypothetical protein
MVDASLSKMTVTITFALIGAEFISQTGGESRHRKDTDTVGIKRAASGCPTEAAKDYCSTSSLGWNEVRLTVVVILFSLWKCGPRSLIGFKGGKTSGPSISVVALGASGLFEVAIVLSWLNKMQGRDEWVYLPYVRRRNN